MQHQDYAYDAAFMKGRPVPYDKKWLTEYLIKDIALRDGILASWKEEGYLAAVS